MAVIRLVGFDGANNAVHPLLLPDTVGVTSSNQRRGRKDLRPLQNPSTLSLAANTVISSAQTIYRMGRDVVSDTLYWLTWTQDVDVVRSLLGDDSTERTYYTGTNEPKWIDNTFALPSVPYPQNPRTLGMIAPTSAPTVTISATGSATTLEKRVYVWTWVSDHGEESQPSPASTVPATGSPTDSTWQIVFNGTVPATGPSQSWTYSKRRLYRSTYDSNGVGSYVFVAEYTNLGAGYTVTDNVASSTLSGSLESLYWAPPPSSLVGLTAMWNGMMAGFTGKSVYFCEPYVPYAWPVSYVQTVQDTIVGLAVWQQNLLVLTTGKPVLVTGSEPASLSMQPVDAPYACVAKKSIVEMGYGVIWACPDGLAFYGTEGFKLLTSDLYKRDDWQALSPTTMIGTKWEGMYLASYNPGSGRVSLMLDPMNPIGVFYSTVGWDGRFLDPLTNQLYLLDSANQQIKKWMAGTSMTATFTSKVFRMDKPTNFAWGQVLADSYPVTMSVVADGVTQLSNYSVSNGSPFRLPAGFMARNWQISIVTTTPVQEVLMATSMAEIQAVP